ncbi:7185_t:CDS:2 [Cetraspora pellucida]|uniref:7185_t:CDS:1 n=1 Tax=Cetraspora pellucida TaxID=1433469 RepID=A0A9N8VXQ5_9GLOM|nr:7185_t:CDS:2 [Cetraspora pellucida]
MEYGETPDTELARTLKESDICEVISDVDSIEDRPDRIETEYNGRKNKKSKRLDEFVQLIKEVKKSNQYVKYGLYLESHARTRGWLDLLSEICPDLSLTKAKAYLYNESWIENNHKNLKNTYHSNGIWNELNEKIQIQELPPLLKDFIEDYIISQNTEISIIVNRY